MSDATEPTIVHLPAQVREALDGIAAARGVSTKALVERVLENAVAAEARWRRYPRTEPPGRRPGDARPQRRVGDLNSVPTRPEGDPACAEEPSAPGR